MTPDLWCGECKGPTEVQKVDFGIGSYEFWGQKGFDSQIAWVSTCCEADVFSDKECTVPYFHEPDDWRPDHEPRERAGPLDSCS
jgi:hypothetical protein